MDDVSSEHYSMFFVEEEVTHKQLPVEKSCYWATRWGVGEDDDNSKQPYEGYVTRDSFLNHILVPENISYPRITVQKDKIL